jgi:hypothetical protein
MNTYKVDESGRLPNGTQTIGNYSARAIFSSTIKYIQLPAEVYSKVISFLLYDKSVNGSTQVRLEKDPADSQFYYYATCKTSAYLSVWLRLDDTWFEVQPKTFILDRHPS